MRVVIDANVFLSYLLHPQRRTAASQVVLQAIRNDFELVFPWGVAVEVRAKVREKPYFRERIDPATVDDLLSLIEEVGLTPNPAIRAPVASRDSKDQYLLDAAADGAAFLISGDRDLLDLEGPVEFALIVTPGQFLSLFESPTAQDE